MRQAKQSKKIRLSSEVLKRLTPGQARLVGGGAGKPSDNPAAC